MLNKLDLALEFIENDFNTNELAFDIVVPERILNSAPNDSDKLDKLELAAKFINNELNLDEIRRMQIVLPEEPFAKTPKKTTTKRSTQEKSTFRSTAKMNSKSIAATIK
ncbi:MAG: hypothetical protein LBR25_04565 [Erysipelotrichaceae bacterium]|jgi:hypothetical protein|nr:hypothetical protein [Erysipelotrichaceae bacterium]